MKQTTKIDQRLSVLESGGAQADPDAPRRCRQCYEPRTICDGHCWGIWRDVAAARGEPTVAQGEAPLRSIAVGDRVVRSSRLGPVDHGKQGTVVEVKRWSAAAKGGSHKNAVRVLWDDVRTVIPAAARDGTVLYRWGVVGVDGHRIYDVEQFVPALTENMA